MPNSAQTRNCSKRHLLAPIEAPDADAETIRQAFLGYASASETKYRGLGCLMANTAVERAALDPGSTRVVHAYLERFEEGFRNALKNAHKEGDVDDALDLDDLAAHFVNAVVPIWRAAAHDRCHDVPG